MSEKNPTKPPSKPPPSKPKPIPERRDTPSKPERKIEKPTRPWPRG